MYTVGHLEECEGRFHFWHTFDIIAVGHYLAHIAVIDVIATSVSSTIGNGSFIY